jgi:hypothetical protein
MEATEHIIAQAQHSRNPHHDEASTKEALWRTLVANRDGFGDIAPDTFTCLVQIPWNSPRPTFQIEQMFYYTFRAMLVCCESLKLGGRDFRHYFPSGEEAVVGGGGDDNAFLQGCETGAFQRAYTLTVRRKLLVTANGYFGLAPQAARQGDIISILLGCSVPAILRPDDRERGGCYRLVGECYVHGIMNGEAMKWLGNDSYRLEEFTIFRAFTYGWKC